MPPSDRVAGYDISSRYSLIHIVPLEPVVDLAELPELIPVEDDIPDDDSEMTLPPGMVWTTDSEDEEDDEEDGYLSMDEYIDLICRE